MSWRTCQTAPLLFDDRGRSHQSLLVTTRKSAGVTVWHWSRISASPTAYITDSTPPITKRKHRAPFAHDSCEQTCCPGWSAEVVALFDGLEEAWVRGLPAQKFLGDGAGGRSRWRPIALAISRTGPPSSAIAQRPPRPNNSFTTRRYPNSSTGRRPPLRHREAAAERNSAVSRSCA